MARVSRRRRAPPRTGVLVIRAWAEEHERSRLRVRIMSITDIERGPEVVTTASSEEQIVAALREWIQAIRAG